ncbi:hypothetical protein IWW36_001856 [Coemansia brasiliensis]|uniref:Uncharacterized protein n=1 Tax=Coemansia brasiliensis TaxID=2650707 RepID=A0A9W8M0G4_9FUNG|nr:hypothetical protein IWW36_001856 [Coemansia brasiliensis]
MLNGSTTSPCDYLKSIQAQQIELGTLDMATSGITNNEIYIYKNTAADPQFMSLHRIASGLYKVIADHYPMLVGRPLVNAEGKGVIDVDPDNLCMPDIADINVDHPAEAFMETSSSGKVKFFNLHKFYKQSGVDELPHATYTKDHSAAIVRTIRFHNSDYVALYISISHIMFDGIGATAFFNNWAECTRNLDNPSYQLQNPPVHDRKIVSDYFDSVIATEPPHIQHLREQSAVPIMKTPDNIAKLLLAAPETPSFKEQHLIHFTKDKFEQIRQDVDPQQTTNLALAALLTKVFLQADIQAFNSMPQWSYVMFPYECRQRTKIPLTFSGNLSFTTIAFMESQKVLDSSYKEIAHDIKQHCSKVSSDYAKNTIDVIRNEIGVLFQAGISLCNSAESSYVGLSNLRYMPFYTIDFGYGGPEILSCHYYPREGMMRIYNNKQDGGIDLFINGKSEIFKHIQSSEELLKYAEVIF